MNAITDFNLWLFILRNHTTICCFCWRNMNAIEHTLTLEHTLLHLACYTAHRDTVQNPSTVVCHWILLLWYWSCVILVYAIYIQLTYSYMPSTDIRTFDIQPAIVFIIILGTTVVNISGVLYVPSLPKSLWIKLIESGSEAAHQLLRWVTLSHDRSVSSPYFNISW